MMRLILPEPVPNALPSAYRLGGRTGTPVDRLIRLHRFETLYVLGLFLSCMTLWVIAPPLGLAIFLLCFMWFFLGCITPLPVAVEFLVHGESGLFSAVARLGGDGDLFYGAVVFFPVLDVLKLICIPAFRKGKRWAYRALVALHGVNAIGGVARAPLGLFVLWRLLRDAQVRRHFGLAPWRAA
jgi:hypothetical protein